MPFLLASLFGVRICQVGASFGDLSAEHLLRWKRRRRWLHVLSPRDSMSASYLTSRGVRCDPRIPDLAFGAFAYDWRPNLDVVEGRRLVVFSLRTDQYEGQLEQLLAFLLKAFRHAPPGTRWLPVVQVARDLPGMEKICAEMLREGFDVGRIEDRHGNVDDCLDVYRTVSIVVSNRLHALLIGASQGARLLAVVESQRGAKLAGTLIDLGLESAIVDPRCSEQRDVLQLAAQLESGLAVRRELHDAFDNLFTRD